MATTKQMLANKNNARKSTGPKSAAGKLKSSQNAIKHGLSQEAEARVDELPGAMVRHPYRPSM